MTDQTAAPGRSGSDSRPAFPEDIELDEAGRNWVARQGPSEGTYGSLRKLVADAAVTAAIGQSYSAG